MMNEKMVIKTAKSLNREKYVLEKLNKQIESLKEKERYLKKELGETTENLQTSKIKEQEIKDANLKVKMLAEEEIMKNRKEHNELAMLREMKKNVQKELNRAIQENLSAKYNLESLKGTRKVLDGNLRGLQDNYTQLSSEKEKLNTELLQYKQEYDELMQLYEVKKSEDIQLKSLYNFHFNK
jgi:chromosome segregation ATPase